MFCSALFSQPKLNEQGRYFDTLSFSKISLDETGIWAVSGDSSKIYHYDLASTLQDYPQFNAASAKKFTGILAKGANKVLVATAGDYLLSFDNGVITKLDKSAGILNGTINSLFGDLNNTIVGTDSLAYEANGNFIFESRYNTSYPDKKTIILNNYMYSGYPYGQKAQQFSWSNYDIHYTLPGIINVSAVKLDDDEYPVSFCLTHYGDILLATNKGIRFSCEPYCNPPNAFHVIDTPAFKALDFDKYSLFASKSGVGWVEDIYVTNLIADIEAYDMYDSNHRVIWIASNKGLIIMSFVPELSEWGTINFCEPVTLQITNTVSSDNIKWYRNDTLTELGDTSSVTITKGGMYYAVVSNPLFSKPDTTEKVYYKMDSTSYELSYPYDTLTICKGANWPLSLNVSNYLKYCWLRNGELFSDKQGPLYISEAGSYSALITNCSNINSETKKIEIKTIDKPHVSYNYPQDYTICTLDTVKLDVTTNADYYNVRGPGNYYSIQKKLNLTQPGYYSFYLNFQNIAGCSWLDTIRINTLPLPFAWVEQNGGTLNASSVIRNSGGEVKLSFSIKEYQWYYNSIPISGETDSILHFNDLGLYKVKVTDYNECSNFSNECNVYAPLSVAQNVKNKKLEVFPNPTNGFFTISVGSYMKIDKIEVFNTTGTLVKCFDEGLYLPYTCDIGDLTNGMYLVRVISDKLNQIHIVLKTACK